MTGKQDKIRSLRSRTQEKKFQIEQYRKKAKRRMFAFSLVVVLFTLYFLEDSYKYFGTLENFVIISVSVLISVPIVYNLIVFLLVRKRKKEIKRINRRIHRMMKLEKK